MDERSTTVAAVDWEAYERDAVRDFEAAEDGGGVSEVHVRYLGRRAALPLALREVRDRETGQLLNSLRERRAPAEVADVHLRHAARVLGSSEIAQRVAFIGVPVHGRDCS